MTRTLFPYARARVGGFLAARRGDAAVVEDVARLERENADDLAAGAPRCASDDLDSIVRYVHWLMDRDRKSTGLKALQGRIWEEGYRADELRGEVYPEVPAAFQRWRQRGRRVAIFSSGSVLAQQLLFRHSTAGDLTPLLAAHFDTTTGPKREARSYAAIADRLGVAPEAVLFVSDASEELDAARAAGMQTALCARAEEPPAAHHPVVRTFDDGALSS